MGYEQTIVVGNAGADPELREMSDGRPVCNVNVAVTRRWKDRETGERKESTRWYAAAAYGNNALVLANHVKKGQEVTLIGTVDSHGWLKYDDGKVRRDAKTNDVIVYTQVDLRVSQVILNSNGGAQNAVNKRNEEIFESGYVGDDEFNVPQEDEIPF
jgi:single stranded DNA-binding protein